jgi:hypothetical protein
MSLKITVCRLERWDRLRRMNKTHMRPETEQSALPGEQASLYWNTPAAIIIESTAETGEQQRKGTFRRPAVSAQAENPLNFDLVPDRQILDLIVIPADVSCTLEI